MFFSKVRHIFWAKNLSFFKSGGFPVFCPHRHISAVFELRSTKFWCHVALPEGFPKVSKYVDQSSSVSIKWGFPFFAPIPQFRLEMHAFFTARCPRFLVFDVKASQLDSDHAECKRVIYVRFLAFCQAANNRTWWWCNTCDCCEKPDPFIQTLW